MEKFGERVAAARTHAGWSQARLGQEIGITQSGVHQMETGDSRGSKHASKIAAKTGVSLQWLESGHGAMLTPDNGSQVNAPDTPIHDQHAAAPDLTNRELNFHAMPRDVPILGGASCGDDGVFDFNGQALDYARRPPRLQNVPGAYAVFVTGESMSPWREHGDFVYVHPHQPVMINDYVVVQLHPDKAGDPERAYIKRLVKRTERDLRLLQFKPEGEITIPMKKVKCLHRILDWRELLGI